MFETVDRAILPTHPDLASDGRNNWEFVFRTISMPWIHAEISYWIDGLLGADVIFSGEIQTLLDKTSEPGIDLLQLDVVVRDRASLRWGMMPVRRVWAVTLNGQADYLFDLEDGREFLASETWISDSPDHKIKKISVVLSVVKADY